VALAASYIRTDSAGGLPTEDEQMAAILAYASENSHDLVAHYKDLDAPGLLLYHRPGLKEAINNIKELEDWEVLVIAQPRCVSDTDSAVHEFVHKLSLYGNRLESPARPWADFLADMRAYRRAMASGNIRE
jgi:DNA invertase Pin-like site-specific DNA recombinase